ncbi:N5-glutamine methyltransferase MTQ2 [Angomonas deanei]|uniref:Uncharacterized protein n=1 Tax=Angomonas deanei TaxID=59799 RepID=A0A7G2C8S4_9TRYP|nr:N5-glutamine methyltransferase MTQ2 [Angomonas deanei]CAD2216210.1 hypothetical protein, conserved [Angomonas deanei]|eukprot:EPY29151.1 N5-glutamine methyltransferase MTQ2 [Angomonas deanei]
MTEPYTTPSYYHCIEDNRYRDSVYEPEADTFLFLDAIDKETDFIKSRLQQPFAVVEIGCGSGTVITHVAAQILKEFRNDIMADHPVALKGGFYAVDVNPMALEAAGKTWDDTMNQYFSNVLSAMTNPPATLSTRPLMLNHDGGLNSSPFCLTLLEGSLFLPFARFEQKFDCILFNPPYVPTSLEELNDAIHKKDPITAAWCGGPRGRVVLDQFLAILPAVLAETGACYIVLIKENDVEEVKEYIQACFQNARGTTEKVVEVTCVAERYTGEHLSVHRITYIQ